MIAWVIWADKMWLPEYTGVVSSNAVQYGPPSYSIEADFAELERLRERAMVALSKSSFIMYWRGMCGGLCGCGCTSVAIAFENTPPHSQSELETLVGHDLSHWEQIVKNWGIMVCTKPSHSSRHNLA